jgi:hypothetical protein
MKITFDIERYKKLLEKEKCFNQQTNSLNFEEYRNEFIELLSYGARVQNQISYERRKEYSFLISQYMERVVTPETFQAELLEMKKEDSEASEMIIDDFKQLAIFSVDLKAVEFSSLLKEISDVSMIAQEFGPEEGISDQKFRKSVEKTFLQMQKFFEE